MCIRDSYTSIPGAAVTSVKITGAKHKFSTLPGMKENIVDPVSYTHLRAHETVLDLVCRLLLEKKKQTQTHNM